MVENTASGGATFITGHRGMVGSGLVRYGEGLGEAIVTATRNELDLRNLEAVDQWFEQQQPRAVIHAAGTVGGIHANNSRPVDFLHNCQIPTAEAGGLVLAPPTDVGAAPEAV